MIDGIVVLNNPVNFVDPLGLLLEYADTYSKSIMKSLVDKIRSTPMGEILINQLNASPITFTIHAGRYKGRGAASHGTDVYISPYYHPKIQTDCGTKPASTLRLLAHELGHLTNISDGSILLDKMLNVHMWENPIMFQLEGYNRTIY